MPSSVDAAASSETQSTGKPMRIGAPFAHRIRLAAAGTCAGRGGGSAGACDPWCPCPYATSQLGTLLIGCAAMGGCAATLPKHPLCPIGLLQR